LKHEVLSGANQLPQLTKFLVSKGVHRILLVRGKSSYTNSSAKSIIEPHLESFEVTEFFDFSSNPKIEDVSRGIHLFNSANCQALIAVGGGSVLDISKLIKAFSDSKGDLSEKVHDNHVGLCNTPMIAFPTTAGSGSEATQFAVVYVDEKKFSVSDEKLLPELSFLVPEFTHSTSSYLSASTGMDAMSQAIESFWSVNSTEESREYSKEALQILWKFLPRAVQDNDEASKLMVMHASHLAGKAINIAKTTAAHAISYSFTSYYGIPHGHAVALTLPFFCGYNSQVGPEDCNDERGSDHVKGILSQIRDIFGVKDLEQGVRSFIGTLGLTLTIPITDQIVDDEIVRILGNINAQRMKNNPRAVQMDELRDMLHNIFLKN
jgi:alcohol dehydrogenase